MRVSKRHTLESCIIGTGIPHINEKNDNYFNDISSVAENCSGIRRMGAASIDLAYVAAGKFDGFWEKDLNLWDVSTGVLLVKEAGGKISKIDGKDWSIKSKDILASNLLIHKKLQEKLSLL